uniref:Uncharacterized protein n=1 Tax=Oryza sativa subsp. japonica TaxID=39947 RepID=Q8LM80_ORYSJ|nr:Hypothetical protein similar to myosin heavy chain [Oryza sativa Japonica Group]
MDLDKSTSTGASLKKLQEDGALPSHETMERELGGLNSETVERRVGQVMINGPTTASNVPIPLCEKGTAEREAAINDRIVIHVVQALPLTDVIGPLVDHQAAASLKEGVTQEVSDVAAAAAAATTSGSNIPKKGRKFSSVVCNRRKAPTPSRRQRMVTLGEKAARAKAAQDGSGGNSSASLAAASTEVVVVPKSREATPSGSVGGLVPARGPLADILTWGELQIEMERILQAGARRIGREIEEAKAVVSSSVNERAKLARDLAEVHEDLQKMRELVVGNEQQRQGLEQHMSELENNLSEIRGSLWTTYTGLNQLAVECGVTTTIPANPDEFSLMTSLAKLATAMEEIPSKHAARIGEETSNGIYIGACHVLSCVRLAHPELDLQRILDQGAANDAHLESALADRDRRIQYWRTKFEVAELERTMVEVKKDRAVEALRGREVWFNSYLRSCCAVMAGVSRELQLHLEFLHGGFSRSRRTPAEIDNLAKSMAPLAEKVFQSMDWRWPSW